ncbi:uncharacterized protein LOC123670278 [Melitaea cinxia]|uniref:uncharacterized protein LOC123670278 n=1 Tax=Melitaea cinxia TaxID=113334 RepID=UPI001E273C69|nr:uncharacterized protein LOC123670278 [Melitaea cinxia]
MEKYLIVSFCVVVTFISTEARPWFEYDMDSVEDYLSYEDNYAPNVDTGYNRGDPYESENGANRRGKDLDAYGNNGYGGFGNSGYDSRRYLIRCDEEGCRRLSNAPVRVVLSECPGCKINNYGNGNYNTNIFNLHEGMYN